METVEAAFQRQKTSRDDQIPQKGPRLRVTGFIFLLKLSFKLGFRPQSKLDGKIGFSAHIKFSGFRLSLKPSLKSQF